MFELTRSMNCTYVFLSRFSSNFRAKDFTVTDVVPVMLAILVAKTVADALEPEGI